MRRVGACRRVGLRRRQRVPRSWSTRTSGRRWRGWSRAWPRARGVGRHHRRALV